ncbi:GIN domain-containing protein [Bergeyella sp. RCAD1439]|uniref:GIN domain-containing protein n=1 Tax=Bergeyella anatis TaxID=3113737 RepID=UPI002E197DCC|nr:DUF2807 domain-containing protein [Bergeyella sp. RCAD1439]
MMTNKILFAFVFLIFVSCGKVRPDGEITSRDVKLDDFSGLELKGKYRLFFVPNEGNFVNVETYGNVADNLKIEVSGKTLSITERREAQGVDFYNVTVYSRHRPERISVSDSVEFNVSGQIKSENLRLDLKNNAKFIGAIDTRRTDLAMSGTSRANFTGKTKEAQIKISDTANLIAPYWVLGTLSLDSQNGNYAEVNVEDTLRGEVKNTAKVRYYSNPVMRLKSDKTASVKAQLLK